MDWQTWFALGSLIVAVVTVVVAVLIWRGSNKTAAEALGRADKAIELAEGAAETNKERLQVEVERRDAALLPSLSFQVDEPRGVWFKNTGTGPAHNIQIDARVVDDCPSPRRDEAAGIIDKWKRECQGQRLGKDDRRLICSYGDRLSLIEVKSLTYEDERGKPYLFAGRANDLRRND